LQQESARRAGLSGVRDTIVFFPFVIMSKNVISFPGVHELLCVLLDGALGVPGGILSAWFFSDVFCHVFLISRELALPSTARSA
jgi:hypothetical protein